MLTKNIKLLSKSKISKDFEIISENQASLIIGGCKVLESCGTFNGTCNGLKDCNTFTKPEISASFE